MLIQNYGHLWERRFISLGIGRQKGHLKGCRATDTVDFREQIGVYVLYSPLLMPIYVGQAGNGQATLFSRLSRHTKDHLKKRWLYFSWFGLRAIEANGKLSPLPKNSRVTQATKESLLNEFEAILMTVLEPTLNKQGPRWIQVHEYQQVIDNDLAEVTGYELIDRVEDLHVKIDKITEQIKQPKTRKKE